MITASSMSIDSANTSRRQRDTDRVILFSARIPLENNDAINDALFNVSRTFNTYGCFASLTPGDKDEAAKTAKGMIAAANVENPDGETSQNS